jgi:hypothetical protein
MFVSEYLCLSVSVSVSVAVSCMCARVCVCVYPHWQGLDLFIRLANPRVAGVRTYTISRKKHNLVEIYYSVGGFGEAPLNVFAHPEAPVRCVCVFIYTHMVCVCIYMQTIVR